LEVISHSGCSIRDGAARDVEGLARVWHAGWHDAHAGLLPEALTHERTLEHFHERMATGVAAVRVVERDGELLGFHWLKGDELDHFYLAREARGTGVAAPLMADAESLLLARGVDRAWLACAVGNRRAAGFYTKMGWNIIRIETMQFPFASGSLAIDFWRLEKSLRQKPSRSC